QNKSSKPPKAMAAMATEKPLKTAEPSLSKKVPIELQQLLLDVFKHSFRPHFDSAFPATVQQIKHHLFNRNFNDAFGSESFLQAYAMRWSPSRALAYTQIFQTSEAMLSAMSRMHASSTKKIVCIGGGAGAELVALGAFLQLNLIRHPCANNHDPENKSKISSPDFAITIMDIANWSPVLKELHSCMTAAPPISEYSSSVAKAANVALISPTACTLSFMQEDILGLKKENLAARFTGVVLVTLMFTLNELYSTSINSTTNLLLSLTIVLAPGALLLVVDSPGSYSTVSVEGPSSTGDSGTRKRYPMQWLLDHTLLESAAIGDSKNASVERQWEKLESRESEWFRLSSELRYPVTLEDMRYQLHLYRRL
ncbi:hypothetical protein BDR22DRAFT_795586, partial [Usnea florida]